MTTPQVDDLVPAMTEMLHRMGATGAQIRYSDEQAPIVWMAVAEFEGPLYQACGGLSPEAAFFRLLELLVDGGHCTHCHRPTGVTLDISQQLIPELVCWYQYDPELKTFRRGCEGDTP